MEVYNDLTFGIEWEILVDPDNGPFGDLREPQCMEPEPSWDPSWAGVVAGSQYHHQLRHISVFLRTHGIKALSRYEKDQVIKDAAFALRFPDLAAARSNTPPRLLFQNYFIVDTDPSIVEMDFYDTPEDMWVPVEIRTPIMKSHREQSYTEVERAFGLILESFRIKVNPSCGLHVHIGNYDSGFVFPWVRNTAILCWAAAPLLDLLHPTYRGPGGETHYGLRYFSRVAHDHTILKFKGDYAPSLVATHKPRYNNDNYLDPRVTLSELGHRATLIEDPWVGWCGVRRLEQAQHMEELLDLIGSVQPNYRLAYNFKNLYTQHIDTSLAPRTIEFRQHAGSKDPVAITMWARVCGKLVEFARSDFEGYDISGTIQRAVQGSLNLGSCDALAFMQELGAIDEAE